MPRNTGVSLGVRRAVYLRVRGGGYLGAYRGVPVYRLDTPCLRPVYDVEEPLRNEHAVVIDRLPRSSLWKLYLTPRTASVRNETRTQPGHSNQETTRRRPPTGTQPGHNQGATTRKLSDALTRNTTGNTTTKQPTGNTTRRQPGNKQEIILKEPGTRRDTPKDTL